MGGRCKGCHFYYMCCPSTTAENSCELISSLVHLQAVHIIIHLSFINNKYYLSSVLGGSASCDDVVFEDNTNSGSSISSRALEARVKEVAKQIANSDSSAGGQQVSLRL